MQNFSPNSYFPRLPRIEQISPAHCGPAVLQMLVGYLGYSEHQDAFVDAVNIAAKLKTHGMTVSEMSRAIKKIVPELQFWFKPYSTISDLRSLTEVYNYPVGVEWQGIFFDDADDDNGHYSIVTHIDQQNNIIYIADPYKRFIGSDRLIHLTEFNDRWWDENEIIDPFTGKIIYERDEDMSFIVTPSDEKFPQEIGMFRES